MHLSRNAPIMLKGSSPPLPPLTDIPSANKIFSTFCRALLLSARTCILPPCPPSLKLAPSPTTSQPNSPPSPPPLLPLPRRPPSSPVPLLLCYLPYRYIRFVFPVALSTSLRRHRRRRHSSPKHTHPPFSFSLHVLPSTRPSIISTQLFSSRPVLVLPAYHCRALALPLYYVLPLTSCVSPPLVTASCGPPFSIVMRFDRFRHRSHNPPPSPLPASAFRSTPSLTSSPTRWFSLERHRSAPTTPSPDSVPSVPKIQHPPTMSRTDYIGALEARMDHMEKVPTSSFYQTYAGEFDVSFFNVFFPLFIFYTTRLFVFISPTFLCCHLCILLGNHFSNIFPYFHYCSPSISFHIRYNHVDAA